MALTFIRSRTLYHLQQQLQQKDQELLMVSHYLQSLAKGKVLDPSSRKPGPLSDICYQLNETITKRNEQEEQAAWESLGNDQLVELIKRCSHNKDLDYMCNESIAFLVKYMKANQGGIFLYNNNDPADEHFALNGLYAYDKRKFYDKRIECRHGLVWECFMEGSPIVLTSVPKNYIKITSGLGEATPAYLILIPLISSDNKIGVIELASFIPFEKYEVNFLCEVAESIASMIFKKTDEEKRSKLLANSQELSSQLEEKERVLQQNIEELQATQEELSRQLTALELSKVELERKHAELELQKKHDAELLASQLENQASIHQMVVDRLTRKIRSLEQINEAALEAYSPLKIATNQ